MGGFELRERDSAVARFREFRGPRNFLVVETDNWVVGAWHWDCRALTYQGLGKAGQ
jgi:hypothetical protein